MIKTKKQVTNYKKTLKVINLLIKTNNLKYGKFKDLKNKVILISGATGLIGNNLIEEYLDYGAEVYGVDIDKQKINLQLKKLKKIFPKSKISY